MSREDILYEAETLKRIEEAFDVINDYTIDLYYLSIQNNTKQSKALCRLSCMLGMSRRFKMRVQRDCRENEN